MTTTPLSSLVTFAWSLKDPNQSTQFSGDSGPRARADETAGDADCEGGQGKGETLLKVILKKIIQTMNEPY